MEEKKFDINTTIGFVLMGGILIWMLYLNQPTEEEIQAEKVRTEVAAQERAANDAAQVSDIKMEQALQDVSVVKTGDSMSFEKLKNRLGSFAFSGTLPSATANTTVIENDVLSLTISNKGGYVTEAKLKQITTYDSLPVEIIKNGNASLNLQFTSENRILNTQDLYFEPSLSQNGENTVLTMRLKTSNDAFIEYRYELMPEEYMLGFSLKTQGLDGIINTSQPMYLDWRLKGYRHAKSISYENRYSRLTYEYEDEKHSKLSPTGEDDELRKLRLAQLIL